MIFLSFKTINFLLSESNLNYTFSIFLPFLVELYRSCGKKYINTPKQEWANVKVKVEFFHKFLYIVGIGWWI